MDWELPRWVVFTDYKYSDRVGVRGSALLFKKDVFVLTCRVGWLTFTKFGEQAPAVAEVKSPVE